MSAENHHSPVLEFLTVTSLPHSGVADQETRRIVRSHAIRDAIRRRRLRQISEPRKIRGLASEPPAQGSLTTKFKLNQRPANGQKRVPVKDEEQDETCISQKALRKSCSLTYTSALDAGHFDPFDTLAIKLGPRQRALLNYREFY